MLNVLARAPRRIFSVPQPHAISDWISYSIIANAIVEEWRLYKNTERPAEENKSVRCGRRVDPLEKTGIGPLRKAGWPEEENRSVLCERRVDPL